MPRLRQVPRSEVHERSRPIYDMLFGERCPVATPGTATGSPGNWWTVFAGVPGRAPRSAGGPPAACAGAALQIVLNRRALR